MEDYLHFFLALAPAAAICWYIYVKDKYEKEPLRYLVLAFVLGVICVLPTSWVSVQMEYWLDASPSAEWLKSFVYAFFVIAAWEELAKFLFLRFYMYRKEAFNEPFDGIVYGVMIGMGFATFENVFYVMDGGWETALIRMFTAVPAHAVFGIVMGYYVGRAKFDPSHLKGLTLKGLIVPIIIHGAYDFFLFQESIPLLGIGAIVSLLISFRYAKKMIDEQQETSPFRNQKPPSAS